MSCSGSERHTDGASVVFFRRADIVSTGDIFPTDSFPTIDLARGGTINSIVDALNRQEGGTVVIPGHGRLADESDVVDYRDMVAIVRDRIQYHIGNGLTLDQVKAAKVGRGRGARADRACAGAAGGGSNTSGSRGDRPDGHLGVSGDRGLALAGSCGCPDGCGSRGRIPRR